VSERESKEGAHEFENRGHSLSAGERMLTRLKCGRGVAWRGYRNRAAHSKIIEHPHYLNIHRYDILSHTSKISCADEAFMSATFATERKVFMPKNINTHRKAFTNVICVIQNT
jgi:hypothetical protein